MSEDTKNPLNVIFIVLDCVRIFECAETASYLTYRDSKTGIENLTKAEVSRHRIHSYVQKVGSFIEKERKEAENGKVNLLYADGTKAHGLDRKKNEIKVIVEGKT